VRRRLAAAAAVALLLAACAYSPEAARTRSGGPGADTGNHAANLQLHGGNLSAYGEPNLNPRLATPKK
jgi:Spy/CpxP family protein refolding chaperone